MIEWNIQSRAHVCQGCGRAFKDREGLHTLLFDEREGYQRLDVCEGCWETQYAQAANHRKGFVSHWHGTYAQPPASPPDPIKRETAETLLRKLVLQNDPAHAAACFILAVMLERKRLLKVKAQSSEEGRRVFVYEQPKTGDLFTIPDPNLQLDQLEAVQRDVAHLLEHGLDVPVGSSEPTSPPRTDETAPTVGSSVPTEESALSQAGPNADQPKQAEATVAPSSSTEGVQSP